MNPVVPTRCRQCLRQNPSAFTRQPLADMHGDKQGRYAQNGGAEANAERGWSKHEANQRADCRFKRAHVRLAVEEDREVRTRGHVARHLDHNRIIHAWTISDFIGGPDEIGCAYNET